VRSARYLGFVSTTQKIRYSDCDPQGIVFNGNYARYWDDAVTDWFDDAGLGGADLGGTGVDVVAARIEMDFRAPAYLGDTLQTDLAVERYGSTSMTVGFTTRRMSDETVVAEGREVIVFVDPDGFRPTPVPDTVKERLGNPDTGDSVQ
jgi:acyl-CoA thioester hydrolase